MTYFIFAEQHTEGFEITRRGFNNPSPNFAVECPATFEFIKDVKTLDGITVDYLVK